MYAAAAQSCLTLCDPMDYIAHQAPLPMRFSRQEYWSGLPFPSPGDLPDPGIESASPVALVLAGGFFLFVCLPLSHLGRLICNNLQIGVAMIDEY